MRIGLQTWGSEGDARPFANLAAGLARAGHQVTLVITEVAPRDYSEIAREAGFTLKMVASPVFQDPESAREIGLAMITKRNPIRQAELLITRAFDPVEQAMAEAARELCEENDLVIGHYFLHSLSAAAELAGTLWISVQLTPDFIPTRHRVPHGLPDLGPWFRPLAWRLAGAVCDHLLLDRVNRRRSAWGLSPHRRVMAETWASPRLNLVASSPALFPPARDWGDHHRVCGFLINQAPSKDEDLDPMIEQFLSDGTAPVYFGFGSLMISDPEYVAEIREIWTGAVRRAGCRAIFQLPDPRRSSADPAILEIDQCPHTLVFPRCAAVVHHGGAGTTQAALWSGCPSVVVPHVADQFFWGALLRRNGVSSRPLPRTRLSSRRLGQRIEEALRNPLFRQTAKTLGMVMRTENGVNAAIAAIYETTR